VVEAQWQYLPLSVPGSTERRECGSDYVTMETSRSKLGEAERHEREKGIERKDE
jgi:hypothetical protein